MSTEQHEALRICEEVTEYTGMTVDESNRAKVHLKEMHALIVQMADCMKLLRNHTSVNSHQIALIDESLVPATQYLKGPKT